MVSLSRPKQIALHNGHCKGLVVTSTNATRRISALMNDFSQQSGQGILHIFNVRYAI